MWDSFACSRKNRKNPEGLQIAKDEKRGAFYFAGMIFLLYIPVFLAVYPGFFVYDAQDELLQVMTRNFTTHHPLVHVLALGGMIQLVHKLTGSYNMGIACYTLFQMAVLAGILAGVLESCEAAE